MANITIRVSEDRKSKLTLLAKKEGKSLSEFLRDILGDITNPAEVIPKKKEVDGVKTTVETSDIVPEIEAIIKKELARLTRNMNGGFYEVGYKMKEISLNSGGHSSKKINAKPLLDLPEVESDKTEDDEVSGFVKVPLRDSIDMINSFPNYLKVGSIMINSKDENLLILETKTSSLWVKVLNLMTKKEEVFDFQLNINKWEDITGVFHKTS